jgi:hydrogenase maturation factor
VGVPIVTGDTKVVDRGKGDGIYINTAGIGGSPMASTSLRGGPAPATRFCSPARSPTTA